jgi:hypothetical protein
MKSEDFTVFYSGTHDKIFGTGFVMHKNYKHLIMDYKAVDDRISILRIRERCFNIALFSIHAPSEAKEDEVTDAFYEKLEEVYNSTPRNNVKIILDLNAKIGREEKFRSYIGKESMQNESNVNGVRVTDFAISMNMKISSTFFQRKKYI